MVVKGDQEKIRTLLKDTITLLCKNGLAYNLQFSVEALIGITLDKDDVFLVSINETVRSAAAALEKADQHSPDVDLGVDPPEGASDGDGEVSLDGGMAYGNNDHSKRMKHTRRKRRYDESEMAHPSETDPGGGGDYDDSSLGGLPDDSSAATSLDAPPTKARFKQPKMEDSDSDRKDVVVIKEEADDDEDDWTIQSDMSHGSYGVPVSLSEQQQAQQQHHSAVDDADLSQVLQSGSLVPVSVQHGHAQSWANQQQRQSSTVTGDLAQGDSSDNQQVGSLIRTINKSAKEAMATVLIHGPGVDDFITPATGAPRPTTYYTRSAPKKLTFRNVTFPRPPPASASQSIPSTATSTVPPSSSPSSFSSAASPTSATSSSKQALLSSLKTRKAAAVAAAAAAVSPAPSGGGDAQTSPAIAPRRKLRMCPVCKETFMSYYGYIIHKNTHEGIFPYKCELCGGGYVSKVEMDDHIMANHPKCHICPQVFKNAAENINHMRWIHRLY